MLGHSELGAKHRAPGRQTCCTGTLTQRGSALEEAHEAPPSTRLAVFLPEGSGFLNQQSSFHFFVSLDSIEAVRFVL